MFRLPDVRLKMYVLGTIMAAILLLTTIALWIVTKDTIYVLAYMKMTTVDGGKAYELNAITGRISLASIEYSETPFNPGFSLIKVSDHHIGYRYPVDHDPLTGDLIFMGFEYQILTSPKAQQLSIPFYFPTLLFGACTALGSRKCHLQWRKRKRMKFGLCFYCGYDLRVCPSNRCSECGSEKMPSTS